MAVEIARSLEEIDRKVKDLNKTLRSSAAETRELDKALRLDSKNADANQEYERIANLSRYGNKKGGFLKQK